MSNSYKIEYVIRNKKLNITYVFDILHKSNINS